MVTVGKHTFLESCSQRRCTLIILISMSVNPVIQPNAHLGADDLELMKEINQELEVNMAEPMGLIKR